jgi:integrase
MVLVAYMHRLGVSELVDLRWEQIDFRTAALHVRRVKQGTPSAHPILGDELRALRRLQREQESRPPFAICLVVRVQRLFSLTRCCRGEAPGNHAGKWGVAIERSRRRTLTRSIGVIGVIGRRYSIRMHPMPPMVPMQFSVEEQIRSRRNSQPPRSPLWSLAAPASPRSRSGSEGT